jgi:alpha-mannosidase II
MLNSIQLTIVYRYGWSIDPFGHSPTMAFLLQNAGFEAAVINRCVCSHTLIILRFSCAEFTMKSRKNWHGRDNWNLNGFRIGMKIQTRIWWAHSFSFCFKTVLIFISQNDEMSPPTITSKGLLTHMMPFFSYDIPHTCGPQPSICAQYDFQMVGKKTDWGDVVEVIGPDNVKDKSLALLDQYKKKSTLYRTKNVLAPLGLFICLLILNDFNMNIQVPISHILLGRG